MKEQWKKHDSDAKLLHNVEEGIPQPIKIELPISAFGLKQDGCCNRLITFLRVAVLCVLLLILCWTAVTLYSNYYPRQLVSDEKTEQLVSNQHDFNSEENKLSFRNKVYRMSMFNEQDAVRNEIDSYAATSAPESLAGSELPVDKVAFNFKDMGYIPQIIKMKNVGGIRIIDFAPKQENNENESQNINSESLETKLHDYIFKERLNLENLPEVQSVNEDDVSETDQQAFVKLVNIPLEIHQDDYFAKRFNLEAEPEPKSEVSSIDMQPDVKLSSSPDKELTSDKEDSMEGLLKNIYKSAEENDKNEIIVTSNFEDENVQNSGEDMTKFMEPLEVDEIDQLISDIANLMGIYEEPSSEVNQSNEESAAIIQEEIKNNEEKLEIVDLENVSSAEEKPREESVAIVQEEIKDDNDNLPTLHFVVEISNSSSEEEDPDVEAVAVIQEEIKSESGNSFNPERISTPIQFAHSESNYQDPWKSNEDNPIEKSQEKTSSEDTSIDDLDKNISQDVSSVEDKSREILSTSETMNNPQINSKAATKRDYSVTMAKLLMPFVGNNYELAHWYHSTFLSPFSPQDDKKKEYAAKVLYNENISEFDIDMEMWLNEILEDPYISDFSDIVNPQKQIEADTFVENQIADKLLEKMQLKEQYDLNMIDFTEASKSIAISNSNHLKSWFLATHPSVQDRVPIRRLVVKSMDERRNLYPMIKDDLSKIRTELNAENTELELLKFDADDFSEEPLVSTLEQYPLFFNADIFQATEKNKYLPYNENVSSVEEDRLRQIQQAIIDAQKKILERENDYSEESNSKQQNIIEAMKKVAEEYEQTEKSSEETTTSLIESYNKIEQSEEETDASTIKNDNEEDKDLAEEISPNSNQFESSNANLNPTEKLPFPASDLPSVEEMNDEAFLKWLHEQSINYNLDNEEDLPVYDPDDPFDY